MRRGTALAFVIASSVVMGGTLSEARAPSRGEATASVPTRERSSESQASTPAFVHRVFVHHYADRQPARVHVVTVDLCHAGVSLRATSPDEGPSTVRHWARRVGASIAINGDFFDSPGPRPLGPARGGGRDWPARPAFYYDAILAMRSDARPTLFARPPDARWTDMIATQEVIVVDGEPRLSPDVVHSRNRHPRSALGFSRDGRTMFLALVEGRVPGSLGATTRELGLIMRDLGAWQAIRLDGGGSSTLFVAARGVVNRPADGHERVVANHLGVIIDPSPLAVAPAWCASP